MHLHLQENRSNLSFFENYNYCKNLWFPTILQVVWRVKKIPLRFNKESTTCHVPACFAIRGEKCNVMLPRWQNFWITTTGGSNNDDRDGNKNGMKAIEQLCTCGTLFGTFLHKPNKSIEGKTENLGWKITCYAPYRLGSFGKIGLWFRAMQFSTLFSLLSWFGCTLYFVAGRSPTTSHFIVLFLNTRFPPSILIIITRMNATNPAT